MSQMMSFAALDPAPEPDSFAGPQPLGAASHAVKRMGLRPLIFDGVELCMAMSFVPGAAMWFEVNVYRTAAQGFVLCVKHFYRDEDERDLSRAWECDDFEAVMTALETYDPAGDLRVDVDPDDPSLALPDLAAKAVAIRVRAVEARRQYASLVGEILHDLDNG